MRLGRKLSEGFAVDREAELEAPDQLLPVTAESEAPDTVDAPQPVGSVPGTS